jgi:hypothetical protein
MKMVREKGLENQNVQESEKEEREKEIEGRTAESNQNQLFLRCMTEKGKKRVEQRIYFDL